MPFTVSRPFFIPTSTTFSYPIFLFSPLISSLCWEHFIVEFGKNLQVKKNVYICNVIMKRPKPSSHGRKNM